MLVVPVILAAVLSGCQPTPAAPPGVIVVSLDTLRADHLGAWGDTRGLTPNLDHFASESLIFDQAFAQSNETLYSHASMFTSRYPSELAPLTSRFALPEEVPTLAGVLGKYGWQTAAFVAGGHMAKDFGLERGFGVYESVTDWGSLHETVPLALRWLDHRQSSPFFLFVHGYDTHDRYLKPTPFGYLFADRDYPGPARDVARRAGGTSEIAGSLVTGHLEPIELLALMRPRFQNARDIGTLAADALPLTEEDLAHLRGVYDGSVAYMDLQFGRFMTGLHSRGILDHATVIVLSDHGEELGEDGAFHHRFQLSDVTLHVPLMVRPAGGISPRRIPDLVELTDIMPTVLEIAGATAPALQRGHSLWPALSGGLPPRIAAFSESGLRQVSARGKDARLVAEGISVENPALPALLAVVPIGGVTLRVAGNEASGPDLREALVGWRREMLKHLGTKGQTRAVSDGIRQHGYFDVNE